MALHYLARYAASSGNLRRVLLRRITRAAMQHPEVEAAQWVALRGEADKIVAACVDKKLLDDAVFAASQAKRARAQGKSARLVAAKLQQHGLDRDQIATALAAADAEQEDDGGEDGAEYRAALRLAQRKKLGRFGVGGADPQQNHRAFGVLARAGFSSAIARRVLQSSDDGED
jgi:regulatory protein